jgi:hypothetical protein
MGIISNIYRISKNHIPSPNHPSLPSFPHTYLTVRRTPTILQLNIPLPLSLISHTLIPATASSSRIIEPLPHTMHSHTPINNLQECAHRQRQRKENIHAVTAPNTSGPDAHDDEVGRFEFVRGREPDFDESEEEAEGGEGDYYAEGCAVDRPVKQKKTSSANMILCSLL